MTEHGAGSVVVYSPDQMDSIWSYANPWRLLTDLARRRQLIGQFVLREVQGRYRGSYLGIVWAMVSPLLTLAVYTLVFAVILQLKWSSSGSRAAGGFLDYALHMFSGMIAYGVFAECANRAPSLIVGNPNYVKKVVFPLEVLPVSILGSALVHSLFSVLIVVVALAATGGLHWTILLLPLAYLPLMGLGLGVAWLLSSLGTFIRDIGHVTSVVVQLLFFLTPITYPLEQVKEARPNLASAMWLNPLAVIVDTFRRLVNEGRMPDWPSFALVTALGLAAALLGYAWFMKMKRALADVI